MDAYFFCIFKRSNCSYYFVSFKDTGRFYKQLKERRLPGCCLNLFI